MNDTELLLNAIGQIPGLVDAAKTYKESNEKTISTLATAVRQQPKAEVPQTEISKVTKAIASTQCSLPDTEDLVTKIKDMISPLLQEEIARAVKEYKIVLHHEHNHKHYSIGDLWKIVDNKTRNLICILYCVLTVLIAGYILAAMYVYQSRLFLGQECWEIYTSGYVTEEEKKVMIKDFNGVSAYPEKYKDSPWALREKIRKNRSILKDRRKQARKNKGKYYIEENVGF